MSLVLDALKLLGLDIPAAMRNARAAAKAEIALAREEVRRTASRASVLAPVVALAAAAAVCLTGIALFALYLWVAQQYGVFAGLGADAAVLVVVIGACVWCARVSLAPSPRVANAPPPLPTSPERRIQTGADTIRRSPAASPAAAAAQANPAAIAALAGAGPAALVTPLLTEALRHLQELAEDPGAGPAATSSSRFKHHRAARGRREPSSRGGAEDASDPSEQQQDEENDDDEAKSAAAVVTRAVERAAADSAESAQQRDDENDQNNRAKTHFENLL